MWSLVRNGFKTLTLRQPASPSTARHSLRATRHASTNPESRDSQSRRPRSSLLDAIFPHPKVLAQRIFAGSLLLAGGHIFVHYFYSCVGCEGVSMLPSLNSFGDWVVISKYYRRGRGVEVGDVVSFKHPIEEETRAIKRILGMPGDFVCRDTPGVGSRIIQVPDGHCWVVGDNLAHSRDSRLFGPLPLALIRGKVVCRMATHPHYSWPEAVPSTLRPAPVEDDVD